MAGASAQAAPIIDISIGTLPADGIVGGPAGSTLGWGYTITNNSTYNLLISSIDVAMSLIGVSETLVFNGNPYLAAGTSVTVDYVPGVSGLFEFTLNPGLPVGTTEMGTVHVRGNLLNAEGAPVILTAHFTAIVTPEGAAVPEPGTLLLLGGGLAALAGFRRTLAA